MANPFVLQTATHNKAFVTENSLGHALITKPHVSKVLPYVLGNKYGLSTFLEMGNRMSKKYQLLPNNKCIWPIMGLLSRAINVTSAATNLGANNQVFEIGLAEDYFNDGQHMVFGSELIGRVLGNATKVGTDYFYKVQLLSPNKVLEQADIRVGATVTGGGSSYPELSTDGYGRQFYPTFYENYMTIDRHSIKISGSAMTTRAYFSSTGNSDAKDIYWFYEAERQGMDQFMEDREYWRWFGQKSVDASGVSRIIGSNGHPVITGSGVFEFLEDSPRYNYTPSENIGNSFRYGMREDDLMQFLADLSLNVNISPDGGKQYIAAGGRMFLIEFKRAIKQFIQSNQVITDKLYFRNAEGKKITVSPNNFETYEGILNMSITLMYIPLFDHPHKFPKKHPRTGYNLMSYRGVLLDTSMYGGESNISLYAKGGDGKDRTMIRKEVPGMMSLDGKSPYASSPVDGTEIHYLSETMLKIAYTQACGVIEVAVN